jgi:hypothetical protein
MGNDTLKGGPGNDEFWAGFDGTSLDNIDGGAGTDTLHTWDPGYDTYSNIESIDP